MNPPASLFRRVVDPEDRPLVASVTIAVSPAELMDKITILEIKAERLSDPVKRGNVRHELDVLLAAQARAVPPTPALDRMVTELKQINARLWDIEDGIRVHEKNGDFGAPFVALARAVYRANDRRAAIKRRINEYLGATIREEKSYV